MIWKDKETKTNVEKIIEQVLDKQIGFDNQGAIYERAAFSRGALFALDQIYDIDVEQFEKLKSKIQNRRTVMLFLREHVKRKNFKIKSYSQVLGVIFEDELTKDALEWKQNNENPEYLFEILMGDTKQNGR